MAKKKIKIIGFTISLTWLAFISLAIFLKGLGELIGTWFSANALLITIISGVFVLILIITGAIAIGSMMNKGRGFFG